jgi:hypothetical protein
VCVCVGVCVYVCADILCVTFFVKRLGSLANCRALMYAKLASWPSISQ